MRVKIPFVRRLIVSLALVASAGAQSKTYTDAENNADTLDTTGNITVTVAGTDSATQSGIVGGTGSLNKSGTGTLNLTGANTFSGGLNITDGTLQAEAGSTTASFGLGPIHISTGGAFELLRPTTSTYYFRSDLTVTGAGSSFSYAEKTATGNYVLDVERSSSVLQFTVSDGGKVTFNAPAQAYSTDQIALRFRNASVLVTGTGSTLEADFIIQQKDSLDSIITVENGGKIKINKGSYFGLTGSGSILNLNSGGVLEVGGTASSLDTGNGFYAINSRFTFNFAGGTLRVIDSGLVANVNGVLSNTSTIDTNGLGATYSGIFSGAGNLVKAGVGDLTLTGANTFTGTTAINAGTVTLGHADALAGSTLTTATGLSFGSLTTANLGGLSSTQNLALTNASSAAVALIVGGNNSSTTYSGILSGTGSLTKSGSGTLTLTGTNTYSGGTTVSAGTLSVASAAQLGSGNLTVNGGTLSGSSNLSLDRTVAVGGSDATLSTVGFLEIGSTGTGSLAVSNGGQVSSGASIAFGVLTGSSATASVSGTNSRLDATTTLHLGYRGTGTLTVGDGGTAKAATLSFSAEGGTGTLNLNSGGTVEIGAINTAGSSDQLNLGGGTLKITGNTFATSIPTSLASATNSVINTNGHSASLTGAITGNGALTKSGTGNLTLSGTNSYAGGTTVSGGSLTGNTGSLPGNITNNAAVVFDQASAGTYAGSITGSGAVTKSGAGNLTFTGTHDYSGGTTISGGTLTGNAASLQGNISNSGSLVFSQSTTGTYAGNLSGSGSLTKTGTGNLTLSGTNTYQGGTTLSGGTLTISSDAKLGDISGAVAISNGATLATGGDFRANRTITIDGSGSSLTNNGELIIGYNGTGSLALTNNAAASTYNLTLGYTGGSGTVGISSGSALTVGNITQLATAASTLTLNTGATLTTGGLTGTGIFNLAGGTLRSGAAYSSSLPVSLSNASTVNTNGHATTLSGTLSGDGSLTKTGAGTLTLVGTNTYSGGTTISDGTLSTTAASLPGSVSNNASLVFAQTTNGTYASVLSGSGSVSKSGSGTLTLTGANTYSGSTTIAGGTLALGSGGSIANSSGVALGTGGILDLTAKTGGFSFGSGQTLSGTGTINLASGQTLDFSGTLAPGNSPGVTTVNGNFTLNSSAVIAMELAGSGGVAGTDFDQLSVSGTLTLGGTLNVTLHNGFVPGTNDSLQLFTATSIGGTFGAINLPTIANATWDTSALATSGVLRLAASGSAVPEPAAAALFAGLATLALAATRRRQR